MRGEILDADGAARSGVISGEDGNRYRFSGSDWKPGTLPRGGVRVDFIADGEVARDVFALPGEASAEAPRVAPPASGDSSVLLGVLGIVCIVISFGVPLLPLVAAIILGLIGAGTAKRTGNSAGLVLGRISWIGALFIGLAEIGLVFFFAAYAWPFLDVIYQIMLHVLTEEAQRA